MTLMKPALRDRITKRGYKFDEHVCSRRTKSTRNWSFLIPGCHRRSRISCFPSLRTSVSPCRSTHPSPSVGSRGCTWRPHFFSPLRRAVAKIHADFSRGSLRRARVRVRHPPGKKKASLRPTTLSPPPSRRALFSFCRHCPTWRYVKRIYNWRYDGRALESNTSILIPATYAAHPTSF